MEYWNNNSEVKRWALVSSFSAAVVALQTICVDPKPSPAELNGILSRFPELQILVLHRINSTYYNPLHINSPAKAIVIFGVNTIRHLALDTALSVLSDGSDEEETHDDSQTPGEIVA